MKCEYKIESGVPIPKCGPRGNPEKNGKYPWRDMAEGDSIQVSSEEFRSAARAAYNYGYNHGRKYSGRSKELRIWRVQ